MYCHQKGNYIKEEEIYDINIKARKEQEERGELA
jgi:hypothetical protein